MRLFLGTAYLLLFVLSDSSFAQLVKVDHSAISHAELIAPGDSRFPALRDEILKAVGTNDSTSRFQHIAIVLQNKSTYPILGYAIKWEVISPSGETSKVNLIWWQRLALAAVKGEADSGDPTKVRAAHMVQVVAPGATRLITPFFNLSRQSDLTNSGSFSGPVSFPTQVLAAASIKVTLDSVVYGDGLCEGEDALNLCTSINGQLDGVRTLIDTVRKLEDKGTTRREILDQVLANSPQGNQPPSRGSSAAEWSAYSRAILLEDIDKIRSRHGDDRAMEELLRSNTSFRVHR